MGFLSKIGASVTGNPDYRFGDISRAAGGAIAAGVEGAAQAAGAGDYRFGDVSRSIAGGVTQTAAGTGTFLAGFFAAQEVQDARRGGGGPAAGGAEPEPEQEPEQELGADTAANIELIWTCFFGQCYEDALAALRAGELQPEDVLDREVFFFIGLPARTLLGTCFRSLDDARTRIICPPAGCFTLASGLRVWQQNVPPALAPLFGALQQIKTQLADANLTPEERSLLQFETLFGGTDRVHPAARSAGAAAGAPRADLCHRLAGALGALATQVTQLAFYKANFSAILERLDGEVATEMEAAQAAQAAQGAAEAPSPAPAAGD